MSRKYISFNKVHADRYYLDPGGAIVVSPTVNATSVPIDPKAPKEKRFSYQKFVNWVKSQYQYYKRVKRTVKQLQDVAREQKIETGWTIERLGHGNYISGDDEKARQFDERSYKITVNGVSMEYIEEVALRLLDAFDQESVLIEDFAAKRVYIFDDKEGGDEYWGSKSDEKGFKNPINDPHGTPLRDLPKPNAKTDTPEISIPETADEFSSNVIAYMKIIAQGDEFMWDPDENPEETARIRTEQIAKERAILKKLVPLRGTQVIMEETFGDKLREAGIESKEENLSFKVPHVGYGGASKRIYTSPNTGKEIYVLETNEPYAADAFVTHLWQFDHDFTVEEAKTFLEAMANMDMHSEISAKETSIDNDPDIQQPSFGVTDEFRWEE